MYVRRVELTDFRSYERVSVDLDPGVSVLVGQNGMGKTNLVEALGYVATLDSHRVATDAPLVRAGAASRGDPLRDRPRWTRAAGRAGDRAGQGQPGPAQPVAGAPAPRGARRAAHGAVRPGRPRAGPRRPGRPPPLPRRPAGRPAAAIRRGARRLRPGGQAAQRPAAHGVPDPQGRRQPRAGSVHARGLGPAPGPARRRVAGRPARAHRGPRPASDQGVRRGGAPGGRRPRSRTRRRSATTWRPTGPPSSRPCSPRWPTGGPPRSSAA